MLTGVKHTRSGIPIPLDPSGCEMCLLFIKYGRCRFKSKCRKSHWMPPLPDEEYPEPPPLPSYSPPPFSVSNIASEREDSSHDICMTDEQRDHSLPAIESTYAQDKSTALAEIACGLINVPNAFESDVCSLALHGNQENFYQTTDVSQLPMFQHHPGEDRTICNILEYTCGTDTQVTKMPVYPCASTVKAKGADMTIEERAHDEQSKDTGAASSTVDSKLAAKPTDTLVDKIAQVLCKRKGRFDFVYNPGTQAKGAGSKYRSSIDQSYKQYGAYYDHDKKKLEFHHQPKNKVEKRNLKLLRKAHWNSRQELKVRLAQLPPAYSLRVDFSGVNFTRLRPYFYLLVHQCFHGQGTIKDHWKPTPFSCLVAETLIALFANGNTSPAEAEERMKDWCARPVRVRQCISHMWNVLVKSSMSLSGVAQEVLNCEQQVFAKKRSGLDYAFACTLSGPLVKGDTRQLANKPTPRIIESVKQGIQAVKRTPLSQTQRTKLNPSIVDENVNLRRNSKTVLSVSRTSGYGMKSTKGVKGKRKNRKRSQQLSILDEQGKQDLLKRCKTILDKNTDM